MGENRFISMVFRTKSFPHTEYLDKLLSASELCLRVRYSKCVGRSFLRDDGLEYSVMCDGWFMPRWPVN